MLTPFMQWWRGNQSVPEVLSTGPRPPESKKTTQKKTLCYLWVFLGALFVIWMNETRRGYFGGWLIFTSLCYICPLTIVHHSSLQSNAGSATYRHYYSEEVGFRNALRYIYGTMCSLNICKRCQQQTECWRESIGGLHEGTVVKGKSATRPLRRDCKRLGQMVMS